MFYIVEMQLEKETETPTGKMAWFQQVSVGPDGGIIHSWNFDPGEAMEFLTKEEALGMLAKLIEPETLVGIIEGDE